MYLIQFKLLVVVIGAEERLRVNGLFHIMLPGFFLSQQRADFSNTDIRNILNIALEKTRTK